MKLPEEYINRMKRLLEPLGKDEFDKYKENWEKANGKLEEDECQTKNTKN